MSWPLTNPFEKHWTCFDWFMKLVVSAGCMGSQDAVNWGFIVLCFKTIIIVSLLLQHLWCSSKGPSGYINSLLITHDSCHCSGEWYGSTMYNSFLALFVLSYGNDLKMIWQICSDDIFSKGQDIIFTNWIHSVTG